MNEQEFPTAAAAVDHIVRTAHTMSASDIHFEPGEHELRAKFRVHGILQDMCKIQSRAAQEIISYVKVASDMRTDEHRHPQNGRFTILDDNNDPIHIRASIMPTHHGEKAVLRLLPSKGAGTSLALPGLHKVLEKQLHAELKKSSGIIIATGPTGSGKTTTLYHCLRVLPQRESLSIVAMEDPVEYSIPGVTQIPIQESVGLTFQSGLRALLRQDPDVIMVGEIRDTETARLAIQTALTGHLVLTTLHTPDAVSAIPRLVDIGVEPYLLAATLRTIISQRLIRILCTECKQKTVITRDEWTNAISATGVITDVAIPPPMHVWRAVGCAACWKSGYKGRIGIYELLTVSDAMRVAITKHASVMELRHIAHEFGTRSFMVDGLQKVVDGTTSVEELLRITYE